MAQKVIVELVDDMSGERADETVRFGLDGDTYEIDLTENRAGILRDIIGDYVAKGRKLTGRAASKPRGTSGNAAKPRASREHTAAVRAWAQSHGFAVSERGRIPREAQEAFDAAHAGKSLAAVG